MAHTVLLLLLQLLSVIASLWLITEGQTTCSFSVEAVRQEVMLTCDFGGDMRKSRSDLMVKRFNGLAAVEELVRCQWKDQNSGYNCSVNHHHSNHHHGNNNNNNNNNNDDNDSNHSNKDSHETTTTTTTTTTSNNNDENNNNNNNSDNIDDSNSNHNHNHNNNKKQDIVLYTNGSQLSRYLMVGLPFPPPPTFIPKVQEEGKEEEEEEEEQERYTQYLCLESGSFIMPMMCNFPRFAAPTAPTLLQGSATHCSVELSWQRPYDGGIPLLGYKLNYTQEGQGEWNTVPLDPSKTTYTAAGLRCGTLYLFVLRAYNYMGTSPATSALRVMTNGSAPFLSKDSSLVELNLTNPTTATLNFIGWKTAGCPIKFFTVRYRRQGIVTWTHVNQNISSDIGQLSVVGLELSSKYTLEVTAHSDPGDVSSTVDFLTSATPPPRHIAAAREKEGGGEGGEGGGGLSGRESGLIVGMVAMVVVVAASTAGFVVCLKRRLARRKTLRLFQDNQDENWTKLQEQNHQNI